MNRRQLAGVALVAVTWGASFLFIRVLVTGGWGPTGVSGARTALGVVGLLPFAWRSRSAFPRDRATLAIIAGLGVLNFAVPWTMFAVAQQYAPSGVSVVANAAQPFWSAIIAGAFIAGEHMTRARSAGLVLGFFGVIVLMENRIGDFDREALLGVPLMLLATLCYAVSGVVIRRRLNHVARIPLTVGQVGVAAAILLPTALATGAFSDADFGAPEVSSILTLGVLGSGVVVAAYMWLISEVGPVRTAMVTYLMPPVGVVLGWAILDEPIGWNLLAGMVLIVVGIAVVQGLVRVPGRRPATAPAA